jgi:hypothetical protein
VGDFVADAGLITEGEYLAFTKISRRAAANQRSQGKAPPFVRIGRQIYYKRDGLLQWIKQKTVMPASAGTLIDGRKRARPEGAAS